VTVARPEERQLVDHDEYNGWLDAPESVEVRARVRGHIMKVHFQDGDIIKEGDPLFALDKRPFQAEVDRIRDQVRVFEAQKVAAEREFTRLRDLLARGGSSQSQVDKAEADAKALEAQIQATQKDMERRQLDVEFCDLTAPIGGRVSRALLTEGNLVNAGGSDPLLTTIVALDPIYVYFSVGERAFQRYQKRHGERAPGSSPTTVREQNMPFTFGLDSDAGYPHAGVLNFADNRVDRATGTILARGETQNTDRRFVPGARVRVRLPVSDPYTALLVADTAVLSDQDKKYLLVLGDGQNVLRRDVELGKLVDDDMRVILPGRKEGEGLTKDTWVIILGLQRARLNYPVEPVDASGEPLSPAGTSAPSIPPGDSKP
jgi:RND family efflux transporter MFP subunit